MTDFRQLKDFSEFISNTVDLAVSELVLMSHWWAVLRHWELLVAILIQTGMSQLAIMLLMRTDSQQDYSMATGGCQS